MEENKKKNFISAIKEFYLNNKKIAGITIGVSLVLIITVVVLLLKGKGDINYKNIEEKLVDIYPNSTEVVELSLGTYHGGVQKDYCKIKLPGNYYGWAMYLASDNTNQNFDMATSHFVSDSIENGILDKEEAIQQFHYNNSQLVDENTTDLYATVYTDEQITYEGMKTQISGATDIKELGNVAFYSKGDKKYTDIDVTMYYKLDKDVTLQISYKGPLAEEIGVDKVANAIYHSIELIK